MTKMDDRISISNASKERMKQINSGDKVTNICAEDGNPERYSIFIAYIQNTRTNKFKIKHTEHLARLSDGNGKTWDCGIDVIYPGWLDTETCKELFEPVWQAKFGG